MTTYNLFNADTGDNTFRHLVFKSNPFILKCENSDAAERIAIEYSSITVDERTTRWNESVRAGRQAQHNYLIISDIKSQQHGRLGQLIIVGIRAKPCQLSTRMTTITVRFYYNSPSTSQLTIIMSQLCFKEVKWIIQIGWPHYKWTINPLSSFIPLFGGFIK